MILSTNPSNTKPSPVNSRSLNPRFQLEVSERDRHRVQRLLLSEIDFVDTTLRPNTEAAFDTLVSVYPTGGSDFLGLLEAARRQLQVEVEWRDLIARHRLARAQLELLVGESSVTW